MERLEENPNDIREENIYFQQDGTGPQYAVW